MSTLPDSASKEEVEGEIVFVTVLLTTLDPDADDFDEKKTEYEAALADLESRLETLRTPTTPSPPNARLVLDSPASLASYDLNLPSREKKPSNSNLPYASPLAGNSSAWGWPTGHDGGAEQPVALGSNVSTPSSPASNAGKRPRDSLQTFSTYKRPKTNGDAPGASSASTPASVDSIDRDEELMEKKYGIKNLAASRASIMKKMQEQEAQRLARIKAEREDREFAKSLSSQSGSQAMAAPTNGAQSYFHPNGQWKKPQQPSFNSVTPSFQRQVPQHRVKAENYSQNQPQNSFTPQHSAGFQVNSQRAPQYTSTSSIPNYAVYDDDDADLQILTPSQFAANIGRSNLPAVNSSMPMVSSVNNAHAYQQMQRMGNSAMPHPASSFYGPPPNLYPGMLQNGMQNGMQGGTNVYGSYQPASWNSAVMNGLRDSYAALAGGMNTAVGLLTGNTSIDLRGSDDDSSDGGNAGRSLEDSLRARGYNYMLADPTKTREELEALLENIRPDEDIPPEMRIGSPQQLKVPLMEHQKLGLAWLRAQEEGSNKGGILADDMGLGKTIQALALIATRPSDDSACKTTLIVCPVSLMRQWRKEIEDKMHRRHKLSVYVMHGKQKKVTYAMLSTYDVVITTFGTLAAEYTRKIRFEARLKTNPHASRRADEDITLINERSKWYRIIIDEAQMIKNKDTKTALACLHLDAQYRLCMTGTPMMNNVGELFSLIRFLRIPPYNDLNRFNRVLRRPIESRYENESNKAMTLLQGLLKAILLRRTKKSEIDGKPILQLPERTTEIVHAVFDEEQENFYRAIEKQASIQVSKYLEAGKIGRNYSYILVRLLRLRQACCHPHLIKDFAQDGPGDVSEEEMRDLVNSLNEDVVARIKETNGQFECPICYDAVGNPTIFFPCGHDCCPECFARVTDPSIAMAQGSDNVEAKCPECRNKLDSKKVFDFNAFKRVHMPEECEETNDLPNVGNDEPDSEGDSDDDSDDGDESDADSQGDLRDFIVSDSESIEEGGTDDEEVKDEEIKDEENKEPLLPRGKKSSKNGGKKEKSKKSKGKEQKKDKTKKLAELRKEGLRNASAKKKYLRRLRKNWVSSAKVEKTMEILHTIHENDPDEKTIIFSQFTSFLDLLEVPIDGDGWNYRRYDGSMSPKLRNAAVEDFHDKPDVKIMLVSLKAGNAGLNLTAASQVIILDPFWNPFIEEQAIDRAHRIGQLHAVKVHRVLVQETVEDRIIALQEKKREMINQALDEKAGQSVSRLGRRELRYLFGIDNQL